MKGLVKILLVATPLVFGIAIVLQSSIGSTPVYYHALPEIQFSELFSSFTHTKTNLDRTISEDSDMLFSNIQDSPIIWNNKWNFYSEFTPELGEKLGNAAEKYFGSVYRVEGDTEVNISKVDSKVNYDSTNKELTWDFTYNIYMRSKLFGSKIANEINTTENLVTSFDFLDLDKVYNCASDFFKEMNAEPYKFNKESAPNIQNKLRQKLINIIQKDNSGDCSDFDTSLDLSVWCGALDCDCKKIKPISVVLTITQSGRGSISFSKNFTNFHCGSGTGSCSTGLECGNLDCIARSCGTCWSGNFGSPCSPTKTSEQLGTHRCLETRGGKYECLPDYKINLFLEGSSREKRWALINLNCGEKHKTLKISGVQNYFFEFNGVKINPGDLDLCTLPRINGRLIIYAKAGDEEYGIGGININFDLSGYINEINSEDFVYKFDELDCEKFKEGAKRAIEGKLNGIGIRGYEVEVELLDTICSGGDTSWYGEQYSPFKVDFIEDSDVVTSVYHIIKYEPLGET